MPSDISTTSWSETDASNSQFPPEGWPAGMFPNAVEPSARMNMGGVKRFWNRINPTYAVTLSTTDTFLITSTGLFAGYGLYERWRARFPSANTTTSPTVNIDSVGPQTFVKYNGSGSLTNLAVGDIQAQDHEFWWNGTSQMVLTNPASPGGVSTLTDAANGGLNVSNPTGAVTLSLKPSDLLTKAQPSTSDSVLVMDGTALTVGKTSPIAAFFNPGFPQKASPTSSDTVLLYDQANGGNPQQALVSALSTFKGRFTSTPQSLSASASSFSVVHGLGVIPFGIGLLLRNVNSELGYSPGDTVPYDLNITQEITTIVGVGTVINSTSVTVITGGASTIYISGKSSFSGSFITMTSWNMIVNAWS